MLFVVFSLIAASAMRRAALRRAEYEEELAREAAERGPTRGGGEAEPSPFGGSPLGSLLQHMMSGSGSYTFDPATGRWVDVSQAEPEPPPEQRGPETPRASTARRRRPRQHPQTQSPLGGLLGGMMPSDGSGNFDVQPPDELTTFAEVGGMDAVKREGERGGRGGWSGGVGSAACRGGGGGGGGGWGRGGGVFCLYGPPGVGKTF